MAEKNEDRRCAGIHKSLLIEEGKVAGRSSLPCLLFPATKAPTVGRLHERGAMSLGDLPPSSFELPIFDIVLNAETVPVPVADTCQDLEGSLRFAGEFKVASYYSAGRPENIDKGFHAMRKDRIKGRVVKKIES